MGPRVGLDRYGEDKISCLSWGSNLGPNEHVANCCTNYFILALIEILKKQYSEVVVGIAPSCSFCPSAPTAHLALNMCAMTCNSSKKLFPH